MRVRSLALGLGSLSLAAGITLAGSSGQHEHKHKHQPAAKAAKPAGKQAGNDCKTCKERRAVLDPKLFADASIYVPEAKLAYDAARKYPATLDRIHCFCECQESTKFAHKTLLTCFTDTHGAGCGICIREALQAAQLKERGASDQEVEMVVESLFKTDGHPPTHDLGR